MAMLKWTPGPFGPNQVFAELDRLRRQVSGLYDSVVGKTESRGLAGAGVFPLLNIAEDDDNLYLTAELPGLTSDQLDLSIKEDQLTLRGERKIVEADQKVNYHRREREAGFFRRVISLPTRIDARQVQASLRDGILEVILPKAVEVKPRQINIQS